MCGTDEYGTATETKVKPACTTAAGVVSADELDVPLEVSCNAFDKKRPQLV